MNVRVDGAARVELANAKLLVDRTVLAVDNAPAAVALAQFFKRPGDFEISLLSRSDNMSGRHTLSSDLFQTLRV
jgi:hypothetical protein